MFYVYVLFSEGKDIYYKGITRDISDRLVRHNSGHEKYTRAACPWVLRCVIRKETRSEAMILERKLKNMNRSKLEKFIKKYRSSSQDNGFAMS